MDVCLLASNLPALSLVYLQLRGPRRRVLAITITIVIVILYFV